MTDVPATPPAAPAPAGDAAPGAETAPALVSSGLAPVPEADLARAVRLTGTVAAVFAAILVGALFANYFLGRRADPLNSPAIEALKEELRQDPRGPKSDELKKRIRDLDQELRTRYFGQNQLAHQGALFLLIGVTLALAALKWSGKLVEAPFDPRSQPAPHPWKASGLARCGTAIGGVLTAGLLAACAFAARGVPSLALPAKVVVPPKPYEPPAAEDWARNWPMFRGPTGDGRAVDAKWPVKWSRKEAGGIDTLEGILWKTPVPLGGHCSPVVWNDRLYLSGGNKTLREVYAFELASGRLLWKKSAGAGKAVDEDYQNTGWSAATMVADGRQVYAIFSTGELVAFDVDGQPVWQRDFGLFKNQYGFSNSLAFHKGRLIVLMDVNEAESKARPAIAALDPATGKDLWFIPRKEGPTWASPVIAPSAKGPQIITCANPFVVAYNPESGKEVWRADILGGDVAPSPVHAHGLVFVVMDKVRLAAVQTDGEGDVSREKVAWRFEEEGLPDTSSPVTDGKFVYTFSSNGKVYAVSVTDGKQAWAADYDEGWYASPVLAGQTLYAFDKRGMAALLKAGGTKHEELGRCELNEAVITTPAFVNGRIYVRGEKHLYAIGGKE